MITRDMTIADVISQHPKTIAVFREFGLSCQECQIADFEDVEHGARVHKIDVNALLARLNQVIGG